MICLLSPSGKLFPRWLMPQIKFKLQRSALSVEALFMVSNAEDSIIFLWFLSQSSLLVSLLSVWLFHFWVLLFSIPSNAGHHKGPQLGPFSPYTLPTWSCPLFPLPPKHCFIPSPHVQANTLSRVPHIFSFFLPLLHLASIRHLDLTMLTIILLLFLLINLQTLQNEK